MLITGTFFLIVCPLINADEMKYAWKLDDKYLIFNPLLDDNEIKNRYPKISKVKNLTAYTSDTVEKIPIEDLKQKISKLTTVSA